MNKLPRCAGDDFALWDRRPCKRPGRLEFDGKLWCKYHHQPTLDKARKAEREASEARLKADELARSHAKLQKEALELLELLEVHEMDLLVDVKRREWIVYSGVRIAGHGSTPTEALRNFRNSYQGEPKVDI